MSRIIETRNPYGSLVGNYHFEDRRRFEDSENCSMGDPVRLFGLNFLVLD